MKKEELNQFIGKQVRITFKFDYDVLTGKLQYVDEFSYKHGYRKVGLYYIGREGFRASHVKDCKEV